MREVGAPLRWNRMLENRDGVDQGGSKWSKRATKEFINAAWRPEQLEKIWNPVAVGGGTGKEAILDDTGADESQRTYLEM